MRRFPLALIVALSATLAFAQMPQRRKGFDQGPFGAPIGAGAVGYRSEWIVDETRRFDVPDELGLLRPGPRYIHTHLWYPSVPLTGRQMTLEEYFAAGESLGVPKFVVDLIHANDFGTPGYSFRGIFKDDVQKLQETLRTLVSARAGAQPAPGRFPVVVHVVGQNDFTQDAALFAEYLASRGYIVVTVPYLGTSARRSPLLVHDPFFYENLLRDLELALTQKALTLKSADPSNVFASGHSYGAIYALLLAMRSNRFKGVIGLDPSYLSKRATYEYDLRKFPFWAPAFRTPLVTLHRQSQSRDDTLPASLARSERLDVVYEGFQHGDFTSVPFWKKDLPDSMQIKEEIEVRSPRQAVLNATHIFMQVAQFLDAMSSGRRPADAVILDPSIHQYTKVSLPQETPTAEDVYWTYRKRGLEEATKIAPHLPPTEEPAFITMAKEEGYYGREDSCVDLFRLLRLAFPSSATAQLAAAKGLLDAGQRGEAQQAAEAALRIDPQIAEGQEILKKSQSEK